jgi:hypothetical protein
MTSTWNMDLVFEVSLVVGADLDRIDVYCPGTGLAERHRFLRGSMLTNARHTPYSLVAAQWFNDHPPKKTWKVGDVVPKGTVLGVAWTAAPMRTREEALLQCATGADYGVLPANVGPAMMCREDRVILWIES